LKEFDHEGDHIHWQAVRQMQDRKAQWQALRHLRKPKAQTATGIREYGKN
jgi:hypothetical protein